MARSALILNNPKLTLADTQLGLETAPPFECQITTAALNPQPTYQTIPATGCAGATQSPGRTGWQMDVSWLEDWGVAAPGGLSQYTFDHDAQPVWYRFVADSVQYPDLMAEGQVYLTAGAYGGTFGDGSAALATATWPCVDTPTITNTP